MAGIETVSSYPQVSVIVPARNEEASLADCLQSLIEQTSVAFEIIVVDDHSTDRTREIAESFPRVRVVEAGPPPDGWTGKNNAVVTGAGVARGEWLLFTDADTVHLPGSLARALQEAKEYGANLLSYSPEQIAVSFWEMAVLPVVFAELARQYPPAKVSDPNAPEAAANGQYILVKREAYDAVGGHAAVAGNILEDVALARAFKAAGYKIRFRYAADAVRTRMYRNFRQLRDGWTKNLALLFPNPGRLAFTSLFWWASSLVLLMLPILVGLGINLTSHMSGLVGARDVFLTLADLLRRWWLLWIAIAVLPTTRNATLLQRANFNVIAESCAAIFGMPMFSYLLLRSKRAHAKGTVTWKDRTYAGQEQRELRNTIQTADGAPKTATRLV
jgi:glycosyltransferase involved in cell wall biosynthesis